MNPLLTSIAADDAYSAWRRLLACLQRPEHVTRPRGLATQEITGATWRVDDLRRNIIKHPHRNVNPRFMVAEWLWIAFGLDSVSVLARYNSQMTRFSDDGQTLAGAYGPRLAGQWSYIIETLRRDPASRQAMATIWTPNPGPSKDVPCTISFQFLLRDGRLSLIATMRSSDIWLGLPYDCYSFSQLAGCVAGVLGVRTGYLQLQLGSSHLYTTDADKATKVLEGGYYLGHGLASPDLPGWPPAQLAVELAEPGSTDLERLPAPWRTYARVLRAPTWYEAWDELRELDW